MLDFEQYPILKDAAFIFGVLLLIGAWKYVIEGE